MREATRHCVEALTDGGRLPCSALSRAVRQELAPLFDAGILVSVRSGAGEAIEVRHAGGLAAFGRTHFPEREVAATLPARARAVRGMRNAKQARSREFALLLVRAWRPLACRLDGTPVDLREVTRTCGAAALVLKTGCALQLRGRLALIENLECFLHAERLGVDVDAALYTGGRLAGIVLNALAGPGLQACRFLCCPDYDPVGLGEYLRYRERLGQRVTLHLPSDLHELLRTYGKAQLLQGRNAALMQALRRNAPPELHELLSWMDETNAGLEQEILIGQALVSITEPKAPANSRR